MVIGFKKRFVPKIMDGRKKHTVRTSNRFGSGTKMHMSTDVRTKNQKCFLEIFCSSSQKIIIDHLKTGDVKIIVDGRELLDKEKIKFIKNDGFDNMLDFVLWFKPGTYTEGYLIHWTDLKY